MPLRRFHTCVKRYRGNYKVQRFTCLDQFLVMAFAQLTYRESLRDIEACLRAMQSKLYHMGIRSRVSRNTLAHANEVRDWRIYADFAHLLIDKARRLYADEDFGQELQDATLYASRRNNDRFVSVAFPVGAFPASQRRGEAAYFDGSSREHSFVYPHL